MIKLSKKGYLKYCDMRNTAEMGGATGNKWVVTKGLPAHVY